MVRKGNHPWPSSAPTCKPRLKGQDKGFLWCLSRDDRVQRTYVLIRFTKLRIADFGPKQPRFTLGLRYDPRTASYMGKMFKRVKFTKN